MVATPPFHWKFNSDATTYTSTVTVGGGVYEADGFSTRILRLGTHNSELIRVDIGMFPLREFLHLSRPAVERNVTRHDFVDNALSSYTPTACTTPNGDVSLSMRVRYSVVHETIILFGRHCPSEYNHAAPEHDHPQRKSAPGSYSSGDGTPLRCCSLQISAGPA